MIIPGRIPVPVAGWSGPGIDGRPVRPPPHLTTAPRQREINPFLPEADTDTGSQWGAGVDVYLADLFSRAYRTDVCGESNEYHSVFIVNCASNSQLLASCTR